jgi:hypothetical protein
MNTVLSHYNYVSPSNEGRHIVLVWFERQKSYGPYKLRWKEAEEEEAEEVEMEEKSD